jgi:hypothetical protein
MKKSFDCVEMKNRLQAEMLEREALLGPEEARRKRQQWLATGDDELAKWWRSLAPVRKPEEIPVAVRDDQTPYGTTDKETAP